MAFDPSTAQPLAAPAFDPATAKPVEAEPATHSAKADSVFTTENFNKLLRGPQDFTTGMMKGVVKSVGGLVQMAADATGPGLGDRMTRGIKSIVGAIDHAERLTPTVQPGLGRVPPGLQAPFGGNDPNAALDMAGDIVGQLLPYAMAPEAIPAATVPARFAMGAARGAAAGYAQYRPETKANDRGDARLVDALLGGALGGTTEGATAIATKFMNNSAIKKGMNTVIDYASDNDPALREIRANVRAPIDKAQKVFAQKSVDLARHEDLLGPIPMSDAEGYLQTLSAKVNGLGGTAPASKLGVMKGVLERIAPGFVEPEEIVTRQGIKAVRIGPGKYQLEGSTNPLPKAATDAMLDAYRKKNPLTTTYSQLKSAVETLDDHIGKLDNGTVKQTAQELQQVLQQKLEKFATPQLKSQSAKLAKWKEKNYDPLVDEALKPVLSAAGPVERANAVLDIALGQKPAVAEAASKLVGPQGRDAVLRGAIKRSLDKAVDAKTGDVDAVKFAAFFKDKPALKHFMTPSTDAHIKGLQNLFTESAQRAGVAPRSTLGKGHLARSAAYLGGFGALLSALHGHVATGVAELSAGLMAGQTFQLIDRLMNDSFGRNLLAAASRAKPGSPRMAQILQTISTKFAAPAAGQAASRLTSPPDRQHGGGPL